MTEAFDPVKALARMDAARAASMAEQQSLPFQRHSATSREAAWSARSEAGKLRGVVLATIREHGPCTDERVQTITGMNPSTERPRRIELVQAGQVRDSGRTDLTHSRRKAVLWEATE